MVWPANRPWRAIREHMRAESSLETGNLVVDDTGVENLGDDVGLEIPGA